MWGAGFATGIGVGFAIGIIIGSLTVKQKSWSELSDKEKKIRLGIIGVGIVIFAIGIGILLAQ